MTSALNGVSIFGVSSSWYLHSHLFSPVHAAHQISLFLNNNDIDIIDDSGKDMIEERQSSIEKSYDLLKTLSKERFEILQVGLDFIIMA